MVQTDGLLWEMAKPGIKTILKKMASLHSIPLLNSILKTPFYPQLTRALTQVSPGEAHCKLLSKVPAHHRSRRPDTLHCGERQDCRAADTCAEKAGEPMPKASFPPLSSCATGTFIPLLTSRAINSQTSKNVSGEGTPNYLEVNFHAMRYEHLHQIS